MDFGDPLAVVVPGVHGKVLAVLARSGLPLTGKRAAELADVSIERTRQVLHRLVDSGLIESQRAGQAVLFEINRAHLLWPAVQALVTAADQVVWAVKRRISATIDEILDSQDSPRVTAALFGSIARGDSQPDSDIDVLLITPDEFSEQQIEVLVAEVIRDVEAATGNDCNTFQISRTRFDELVRQPDPMVASLTKDAAVFRGPDFRRRLRGAPWDEPGTPPLGTTASEPRRHESTTR